jgi:hypothetical protein
MEVFVVLRCVIDGLLLGAEMRPAFPPLVVYDGDESFVLEIVEAVYYELVAATEDERLALQRYYRLLRLATDFRRLAA